MSTALASSPCVSNLHPITLSSFSLLDSHPEPPPSKYLVWMVPYHIKAQYPSGAPLGHFHRHHRIFLPRSAPLPPLPKNSFIIPRRTLGKITPPWPLSSISIPPFSHVWKRGGEKKKRRTHHPYLPELLQRMDRTISYSQPISPAHSKDLEGERSGGVFRHLQTKLIDLALHVYGTAAPGSTGHQNFSLPGLARCPFSSFFPPPLHSPPTLDARTDRGTLRESSAKVTK